MDGRRPRARVVTEPGVSANSSAFGRHQPHALAVAPPKELTDAVKNLNAATRPRVDSDIQAKTPSRVDAAAAYRHALPTKKNPITDPAISVYVTGTALLGSGIQAAIEDLAVARARESLHPAIEQLVKELQGKVAGIQAAVDAAKVACGQWVSFITSDGNFAFTCPFSDPQAGACWTAREGVAQLTAIADIWKTLNLLAGESHR